MANGSVNKKNDKQRAEKNKWLPRYAFVLGINMVHVEKPHRNHHHKKTDIRGL